MTAEHQPLLMPTGLALTKFRVPRLRRDVVHREALLEHLGTLVLDHPVTLICAPAGSGKTTLMVQLTAPGEPGELHVWVALEASDNEPTRLLDTLVQSLLPLDLSWEMDPAALVGNVTSGGREARAALAGIVNALCTWPMHRMVWLLDDVHRITDPAAASLLEALIERLPEHVALVLGSRTEPALPLARLRAHGELGELDAGQLRFDEPTVVALAKSRWGSAPPADIVDETLRRTRGWAVGVNLLLASGTGEGVLRPGLQAGAPPRVLFDFLAQEVLDELSAELRDFAVDCAVLPELNPSRCQAVTLRSDSRNLLEELLRRHLFLSVVDEHEPVLRFHDLFRDFLLSRLALTSREHRTSLHERAAAAEPLPERAIGHWLDAMRWSEASSLIARHGLRLAGEGAYSNLEQWIERLPAHVIEADPRLALLRAECAWSRWDWEQVLLHAAPAAAGLAAAGAADGQARAQLLLSAALGALGHLDERAELTERSFALKLTSLDAAQFHLQRAWSAFALGKCDKISGHLDTMNALVAEDPKRYAPQVAQTFNGHFGGLPGVTEACLHFVALCDTVPKPAAMPWHSTPVVIGGWAALWQGRRDGAAQALERGQQLQHNFGKVRYVLVDATHLRALLLAATGEFEPAQRTVRGLLADLESGDAEGLRRTWERPYRSVLSRTLWMAMDGPALTAQAALLRGAPRHREWPFTAGAIDTIQGQAALLAGDLKTAQAALEAAVAHHARYPAPAFYADPRVALAAVHWQMRDPALAWSTLQPALHEVARDGTVGRLLLEPQPIVRALLTLCPTAAPEYPQVERLLDVLHRWSPGTAAVESEAARAFGPGDVGSAVGRRHVEGDGAPSPSDALERSEPARVAAPGDATDLPAVRPLSAIALRLTDREREVLELVAQGLPNKVLARQLSLSAHTVKRHLANILDKLDCDNRGQAADLWRRGAD